MSDIPEHLLANIMDGTPDDVIEMYAGLTSAAKELDFGPYDTNVVVIDTETTGISFKKDELTQIAAARLEAGVPTEWFVTFVDPGTPIPEEITRLTNISDEDVAGAPSPEEALLQLVEFVGDAKLVAHNAAFDRHFVTAHPQGYTLLENEWIDTLELSRIALPRMRSHRLIDLVKAFGAPLSTHRADEDVVATCALYRILLSGVAAIPAPLLELIASFSTPELWPFGQVFKFFAAGEYGGAPEKASPEQAFSLHECRKRRVSARTMAKRKDAATLFPQKMLDHMRESGINVAGPDGKEPEAMAFPTAHDMEDAFCAEGMMGRIYPDYEVRDEQLEMAMGIRDSFEDGKNLMVEAGTGTGKSMAYLVPCAQTAMSNDITVGIATKTNALLDQLVYKELPALAKALAQDGQCAGADEQAAEAGGQPVETDRQRGKSQDEPSMRPLEYVALKGYTHYPCLYRVNRCLREGPKLRDFAGESLSQAPALSALLSYIQQTEYDDIDGLKIDYRALPRFAITTSSSDCLRRRCPFYGTECFVTGLRQKAESADIVVTNHSLLFFDTAADNVLLPPIRYWVVDEAHGAEEEARRALSSDLSLDALADLAKRATSDSPSRNVFLAASRKVAASDSDAADIDASSLGRPASKEADEPATLFFGMIAKANAQAQLFQDAQLAFAEQALTLSDFDKQKKSSYEYYDLWIDRTIRASAQFGPLRQLAQEMIDVGEKLVNLTQEIVALMDDFKGAAFAQRELASFALELKDAILAADRIFINPSDMYVYSITLNRRMKAPALSALTGSSHAVFHAQLYNVGMELDQTLYANTRSIVYTSATLTVNGSFGPFQESMGLNASEQSSANELTLSPCFDFDSNMKVLVINDIPEPNEDGYLQVLQEFLKKAHVAQGGSALTLFTNRRDLDRCFEEVEPYLKEHDLCLTRQRKGTSTKMLRDRFLAEETLSMFALKSFWEGFDAPGATLRAVVIPKLPFSKPDDPLSEERKDRDDAAWRKYVLPRAVIDVRQAAGRLIRKADDRGALILCDSRLLTKSYGKVFVNSLPSKNVSIVSSDEAISILSAM